MSTSPPASSNDNDPMGVIPGETLQQEAERFTEMAVGLTIFESGCLGVKEPNYAAIKEIHDASVQKNCTESPFFADFGSDAASPIKMLNHVLFNFNLQGAAIGLSQQEFYRMLRFGNRGADVEQMPQIVKKAHDALDAMDESGQSKNFPQVTSWLRSILPPKDVIVEVPEVKGKVGWQTTSDLEPDANLLAAPENDEPLQNPTHPMSKLHNRLHAGGDLQTLFEQLVAECAEKDEQDVLVKFKDQLSLRGSLFDIPPYAFSPKFLAMIPSSPSDDFVDRRAEEQKNLNDIKRSPHLLKYKKLINALEQCLGEMYGQGRGR